MRVCKGGWKGCECVQVLVGEGGQMVEGGGWVGENVGVRVCARARVRASASHKEGAIFYMSTRDKKRKGETHEVTGGRRFRVQG
jgi:hypothetical protein